MKPCTGVMEDQLGDMSKESGGLGGFPLLSGGGGGQWLSHQRQLTDKEYQQEQGNCRKGREVGS